RRAADLDLPALEQIQRSRLGVARIHCIARLETLAWQVVDGVFNLWVIAACQIADSQITDLTASAHGGQRANLIAGAFGSFLSSWCFRFRFCSSCQCRLLFLPREVLRN